MSLKDHIDKKEDSYSKASRQKLKAAMRHKIKRTFVGCLNEVESELGISSDNSQNQEVFKRIRSKILSIGNDQIRNMELELDKYNVEFIPYHITFTVVEHKKIGDIKEGC